MYIICGLRRSKRGMRLEIDVLYTPADLNEVSLSGRAVIVVDVLRATTTIITALAAGAPAVYPVEGIEEARQLAAELGGAALGGERGGLPPEGFQRGNSPLEYRASPDGKPIVLTTTNGTRAIARAKEGGAAAIAAGALVNAKAVASWALGIGSDITVLCAGTHGRFSLDDVIAAGCIVDRASSMAESGLNLTDGALGALLLWQRFCENPREGLLSAVHGQRLERLGFEDDLTFCAAVDAFERVPVLQDARLV